MSKATLQIKKLVKEAFIPKKGSPGAAGYDLFSVHETVVPAKGKALVKTGLSVAVPTGNYARIGSKLSISMNVLNTIFISSSLRISMEKFHRHWSWCCG